MNPFQSTVKRVKKKKEPEHDVKEPEHDVNLFLSGNFYSLEDLEFRESSTKLIRLAKDCVVFREAECSPLLKPLLS
jgi:hypothetical protein